MKIEYIAGRIMAAFPQPTPRVADYLVTVQAFDLAVRYGNFEDAFADMAAAWDQLSRDEQTIIGALDQPNSYVILNRAVATERRINNWIAYLVDAPGCYEAGSTEVQALMRMTALLADREGISRECATT